MRVFITGATGLVGSRLVARLVARGDQPIALSRDIERARQKLGAGVELVEGNPQQGTEWTKAVNGCNGVVNLVGEPIFGKRWTDQQRQELRNSRVVSTATVARAIAEADHRPGVLVSASAVGYYGFHGDEELTEQSPAGDDFLARVAIEWEQAAQIVRAHGVRLATTRIGVVLDPDAGALAQMLPPFRAGFGGPVGSGRQWVSWIHRDDIVGILLMALDNREASGPMNATSPEPQTNREFSRTLASVLHRPCIFRVPRFILRARFGQAAEIITNGQRVVPKRALELGYRFQFPALRAALEDLLSESSPA